MRKIALMLTLLVAMMGNAWASSNSLWEQSALNRIMKEGKLRVGLDSGYMPFEMTSKDGKYIGFDVDFAKQMAKAMGVELEIVNTAWDGIIPALMTDKFDIIMSGMTVTAERNLQVNFVDPYIVVGQIILLRKGLEGEIKSYKDLNDPKYKVISKLGTTGDYAIKKYMPKAELRLFETEADGALEVVNGRADAFVYDLPYNAIYSAQNGDNLVHLDEPFTYEPLGWAIRKGDPDFANWLNNFLRQARGDGTYDKIYNRWFANSAWQDKLK
ncbi:MAG: amino acid ABC transporter substrate-binding protein [Oceanospirillales bacterium LUC14_002_19_P2]|nr:MAG: amino acid ABC transporter substrate-binding protein [Oceanospirillales bacterium LUC14_002_19_P2]